jgi:predicted GNAT family N-acyltransferase
VQSNPDGRFLIEPLGQHNRVAFCCGIKALDDYFHTQATQDVRKRVAANFVLVDKESKTVAGFYTLSSAAVLLSDLPPDIVKKLCRYPNVPVTLLGRFAVDKRYRGQGLGELLLMDALKRSLTQSDQIGSMAVIVDAKDESSRAFYQNYDFLQFPDTPNRLFLPMKTISQLF